MKQDMRQLILEQVKEGKLTIDEALDKLERLEAINEHQSTASEHKYVDERNTTTGSIIIRSIH